MRMYIKYRFEDESDLEYISNKALKVSKHIVEYSFVDVRGADQFNQKCMEYLSISTLAVRTKKQREQKAIEDAKLAEERLARRKLLEAQQGVGLRSTKIKSST